MKKIDSSKGNIKTIKFMFLALAFSLNACTQFYGTSTVVTKTSASDVIDLNLGPKGGGTIDPKITTGQTIVNFKEGDGVLLFNLNLSGTGSFATKDVKYNVTSSTDNTITITPSVSPSASVSPTPTPSPSASASTNTISKLSNQIYIDNKKYTLDVSADKLANNKYTINLTGLKKGSIVSLSSQVYDSKSQIIGKESIQNKEVKSDIESFDLNISVNININVEQKTEVNVSQSQVVVGPTINITLPSPPSNPSGGTNQTGGTTTTQPQQQPPPPNSTPLPPPPRKNNTRF